MIMALFPFLGKIHPSGFFLKPFHLVVFNLDPYSENVVSCPSPAINDDVFVGWIVS